ncbi:hypothetical protein CUR178_06424 [Leishmania enriettii]|uniref:Protein kinase domain-containing protein n=1 Tax=Leishmania enriettii TaxID=5663 RepID=A0A836KPY7_LEIEN|nr:hypothetical protein CUR178_06424 [Leishmania enriettii]
MLPCTAPSRGRGPPGAALYPTAASREDTAELVEASASASALHRQSTLACGQSVEGHPTSPTPASMDTAGGSRHHRHCSTAPPLKPLAAEAFIAPTPEAQCRTSVATLLLSSGDLSHFSTHAGSATSNFVQATRTESVTRVDGAPLLPLPTTLSPAGLHVGIVPHVPSSNAISKVSASASSTPSNHRAAWKTRRRPSSTLISPSHTDVCMRAPPLATVGEQHVETHGRCDASPQAPLSVHLTLPATSSTEVTPVSSGARFGTGVEAPGSVNAHCTSAATAASCVAVDEAPGIFCTLPRPSTALSTSLLGVGVVPSCSSSTPSARAAILKDRHRSGSRMCGMPSESSLLRPFHANLFDRDEVDGEDCGSEASGAAISSVTVEVLHRGDDIPVRNSQCSHLPSGRSSSTLVSGGLGGFAADTSGASAVATTSSAAVAHHANGESGSSGGAEMRGAGCSLGRRLFSSLTSQRSGGGAPAPSMGIFQSGLFLSMDEGDASRAPAMDVPMTPQSFSTMLLARDSGEGALPTGGAWSVASAATTTHGARSSPLPVPEDGDAPLEQSSQLLTVASGVGEGGWLRDEVAAKGMEDWFVDSGSGGSGLMLGGRCITPPSSLQLLNGSSQLELPISGVDADEIPSNPTNLSALPHPPSPRSARRWRQRCLDREGSGTCRVDLETGVIETDTLERARVVSKDGARAYEVVNEKYVVYAFELGRGSYSTVRLCYCLWDGHFYALKVLDCVRLKRRQLGTEASLCKIDQEIAMMKQVRHKNIIALHEVIRDPSMRYVYLVLELAESREVLSMRDNGDVLPRGDKGGSTAYAEAATREIGKGLLHALMYAHYLGVAHRDIKPSNVLRTADGTVKLCDFGVSVLVGEGPMKLRRAGSVAFLAPELLLSGEVEVSRFVTPADSLLGTTQSRSWVRTLADDTLASAASTARMARTSATVATSETQLVSTGGSASSAKEAAKSSQRLTSPFAGAAVHSGSPAASLHGPRRETVSFTGGAPSGIFPRPSSVFLPMRGDGGGCGGGAVHSASFRTSSPPLHGPATPAYNAAIVTDAVGPCAGGAAAAAPLKSGSSPSTPAAQQLECRSMAIDHEPVDLFKADVFALGVTMYTMLLGQLPWRASSAASQRAAILAEPDPFLRLYRAAYGDAYRPPAQARDVCMPHCDMLNGDTLPVSSRAATSMSSSDGRSKTNAERCTRQRAIASEKDNPAAPAPAAVLPNEWRQSNNTGTSREKKKSEQARCMLTEARLAAATPSHLDAATHSNRHSAQSLTDCRTASASLPHPASPMLAAKGTTYESHVLSDLAEPRRDDDSRATFAAPLPPMSPQQHRLPQRKPSVRILLGSAPVKSTTAADTTTTPKTQAGVTHRRGGGGERARGDVRRMNATTACMWSRTPAFTGLLSRATTQAPFEPVAPDAHSLSISASQYVPCDARTAAMSCTAGPPSPRSRRPAETTNGSNDRPGILNVHNDDWRKAEPEMSGGLVDDTTEARQWMRHSTGGGLLRAVLPPAVRTTCPHTLNVASSGVADTSRSSEKVATESGDDSSTTVSCSAETSTTSLRSSDDDEEEIESCESIYERLFELEQPCRTYVVTEHTPLPAVPDASGEISGDAVDFVRACLCLDPAERRTVFELFRHPWIRGTEPAVEVERSTALEHPRRCSFAAENGVGEEYLTRH